MPKPKSMRFEVAKFFCFYKKLSSVPMHLDKSVMAFLCFYIRLFKYSSYFFMSSFMLEMIVLSYLNYSDLNLCENGTF